MNPRTLVAMDTKEKIHVIDVRSEEELEVSFYVQNKKKNSVKVKNMNENCT